MTRILLPFCDDSTLIFAALFRRLLEARDIEVELGFYAPQAALSARQIRAHLPETNYRYLTNEGLVAAATGGEFDAIVTSRVFRVLNDLLSQPGFRLKQNRAMIFGFLGGLDFFPETGGRNRRNCDAVFLFPRPRLAAFEEMVAEMLTEDAPKPLVRFGHPSFLKPDTVNAEALEARARTGDIYFFTQALSPSTERGRRHVLRAMAAIARANPHRTVWIKLRHLPDENQKHLHREKFSFVELAETSDTPLPENLRLTDCTMEEAMKNAGIGITCTSTAAIDLVREGVPAIVHLDYVDNYVDKLVEPMRELFQDSGLIKSLDDMLNLRFSPPDAAWMDDMFCPADLAGEVIRTLEDLKSAHSSG